MIYQYSEKAESSTSFRSQSFRTYFEQNIMKLISTSHPPFFWKSKTCFFFFKFPFFLTKILQVWCEIASDRPDFVALGQEVVPKSYWSGRVVMGLP